VEYLESEQYYRGNHSMTQIPKIYSIAALKPLLFSSDDEKIQAVSVNLLLW
jgi:hypothetical protein